jgi:hypothetical protein
MVYATIVDIIPFLVFFGCYVGLFTYFYMILMVTVDYGDDEGDFYNLPQVLKYFLHSYRLSIGDVQIPDYKKWLDSYQDADG